MRKLYTTIILFLFANSIAQEINSDMPVIVPPSPTVAALMKFEEVEVTNYTGLPDVSIPLYSITSHSKNVPLNMSIKYHAGVGALDVASNVGLGWSLFAGGTISRTMRGLPDERKFFGTKVQVGIYHTTGTHANNYYWFKPLIGAIPPSYEQIAYEYMWETLEKGKYDSEHDIWQFNFMGFSGRFYIERNASGVLEVKPLDNYAVKIENHYNSSDYTPTGFTIYDEYGNRYVFDAVETMASKNRTLSTWDGILRLSPGFSDNLSAEMSFNSAFQLTKVYDNNEELLMEFIYNGNSEIIIESQDTETLVRNEFADPLAAQLMSDALDEIGSSTTSCPEGREGTLKKLLPLTVLSVNTNVAKVKMLKRIRVKDKAKIDLSYTTGRDDSNLNTSSGAVKLSRITIRDWDSVAVKSFDFVHDYSKVKERRLVLTQLKEFDKTRSDSLLHEFSYIKNDTLNYFVNTDYFGNFNYLPKCRTNRDDKQVTPLFTSTDLLQKIKYPTGGCTIFDYECNVYSYVGADPVTGVYNDEFVDDDDFLFGGPPNGLAAQNLTPFNEDVTLVVECGYGDSFYFSYYDTITSTWKPTNFGISCNSPTSNCCYTFTLLAGYQYSIKRAVEDNTYGATSLHIDYYRKVPRNYEYGGGNRIKTVGYFKKDVSEDYYVNINDGDGLIKEKHYNYDFTINNVVRSSGSLAYVKPLFNYQKIHVSCMLCSGISVYFVGPQALLYNVTTSFNNLNPVKTHGANVGYKQVTVSETGLGKTIYNYTSPIDYPETIYNVNKLPPFLPTENYDYKRGLLLAETNINQAGQTLKSIEMTYQFVDELDDTGIRFSHIIDNNCAIGQNFSDYADYNAFNQNANSTSPIVYLANVPNSCNCEDPGSFIETYVLKEAHGWAKLNTKDTKDYFYSGSATNMAEVNETYDYNTTNKKLSEKTITSSLGDILKTKYYYHNGDALTRNRISEIEKIETYRNSDLLSTSKIIYSNSFAGNSAYLPQKVQTAKESLPLEDRLVYDSYDKYGNILQLHQADGVPVSYLWGYNRTLPIAKIENASNAIITTALGIAVTTASEANMSNIDGLRTSLPETMVTTYTHKALIGIATIADPKDDMFTYDYDNFNRLWKVTDKQGYILSENAYQYQAGTDSAGNPYSYVQSKNYREENGSSLPNPAPLQAAISKTFLDGLGRPIQQIAHQQAADGNDIITHIEYDQYGRQPKEFLPYVNAAASLSYNGSAATDQLNYSDSTVDYTTQTPISEKEFESSPLSRLLKQGAPGNDWQIATSGPDHTIKFDYQTNDGNDAVVKYTAVATWNAIDRIYDIALADSYYNTGDLYKNIVKNENWIAADGSNNTTEEYKDKEGRVVLKRTFGESLIAGTLTNTKNDTYYVYDQFGNLTYVLPPLVDTSNGSVSSGVLDDLCYQYKYDLENRVIEKKMPGKQWEFIVYDKIGRVVATGPAMAPFSGTSLSNGWLITKYDAHNRPILTAWLGNDFQVKGRAVMQAGYDTTILPISESRVTGQPPVNGVSFDYTTVAIPVSGYDVLTVTYYDDYEFVGGPSSVPTTVMQDNSQPVYYKDVQHLPKGLATGNWVRILEDAAITGLRADNSYQLYDKKARVVRNHLDNYLGGYTQTDHNIHFNSSVTATETGHKRTAADTEIFTREEFTYTDQGRPEEHNHTIGTGTTEILTSNAYSLLGQLDNKRVGGSSSFVNGLQKVSFDYNIRGWLTDINKLDNLIQFGEPSDLFAFHINYNSVEDETGYSGKALYNGNISETYWITASDNIKRKYGYHYDDLSRLIGATFQKPGTTPGTGNVTTSYDESMGYDKNGNISFMKRKGELDSNSFTIDIDDLEYFYDNNKKNQLLKVSDITTHPAGFSDDAAPDSTDDYTYDDNGNMTADENKGITKITYNHLNLPMTITFGSSGKKIDYLYDATGQKQSKTITDPGTVTVTEYLTGFQYQYKVGGVEELKFFPHAEGYVNAVGAPGDYNFNYVYNYTDHLGNIRVSYTWNSKMGVAKILEENHYYPFGLKHTKYNAEEYEYIQGYPFGVDIAPAASGLVYQYKYNGKEYQNELSLNLYDYGARNYDPALGRWMNIDPLGEQYYNWSTYTYCMNNPILFVDPNGMEVETDFKLYNDGEIKQIGKADNNPDRLFAENGDLIADKIDKRILKDGINIQKEGLLIDNLDKRKDANLNGKVGNFLTKLSVYLQKEIWWGFYGNEKGRDAAIVIASYDTNDTFTSDALGKEFLGLRLFYGNHTHPSIDDSSSQPSNADEQQASNAKYYNFIWSNKGVSQFNSGGKVTQPGGSDLVRNYSKEKGGSTIDKKYVKETLKWKKELKPSGRPARQ